MLKYNITITGGIELGLNIRKYKIVSDGTPDGTYIYDPDGKELKDAMEVHFSVASGDIFGTATIVVPAEIELETSNVRVAKAEKEVLPGEKAIDQTYEDSSDDFIDYLVDLLNGKNKKKGNDKKNNLHTFAFYRQLPND